MKNSFLTLLLVLFCSNRCAKEITTIDFINETNKTIVIFSKEEYKDYKENLLPITFVLDRTINKHTKKVLGFEAYKLHNFKNSKNDYVFDIYEKENKKKVDSLIIKKENLKLFKDNIAIYK